MRRRTTKWLSKKDIQVFRKILEDKLQIDKIGNRHNVCDWKTKGKRMKYIIRPFIWIMNAIGILLFSLMTFLPLAIAICLCPKNAPKKSNT